MTHLIEPIFQFDNSGSFTIVGQSIDAFGCKSEKASIDILVYPQPMADFTLPINEFCIGANSLLPNNTSSGGTIYSWSLDEVVVSSMRDLQFELLSSGEKELKLSISNEFGCMDEASDNISINGFPNLEPEDAFVTACENEEFTVRDNNGNADFYQWIISNGMIKEGNEISLSIEEAGIYNVTIIARNGEICSDTLDLSAYIEVFEAPLADFEFVLNPDPNLLGEVQFITMSTMYTALDWDFGDGVHSTDVNPLHIYDINRPITVTHTAINTNNGEKTCIDESSQTIESEWITTFYAPNALSPDSGSPEVRMFKPAGLGIAEYEISIYSPWGEIVWHSTALDDGSPAEAWDGLLMSGKSAPQGVYVFLASVTFDSGDAKTYKGSVHLIR